MALLSAALLGLALAQPAAWHHYDIRVDEQLRALDVTACFADGLPERLLADHPLAGAATGAFRLTLDGKVVERQAQGTVVHFARPSDNGCVSWRSDLEAIAAPGRWNIGFRNGDNLVLAIGTWFWRPPVLAGNRDIELRFHLPENMSINAPWQPLPAANGVLRFRHGATPLSWASLIAFGALDTRRFETGGARFDLAIAPGRRKVDAGLVQEWLRSAAQAVTQLWGTFPAERVQLLVVPVHEGYDAAPWAQTNRGGGAGAHFFMNTKAKPQVFREDWIATHELAHLALPFVERADAWLPEGFASYYQQVLRARAGMIGEARAWQELYEGFQRGNRNTGYDTLADDTLYMHSRGRNMRVYWSGAAIALLADVELRRRSDNAWSLDRVLQEFNACRRAPDRSWSARELFASFDEISGGDVFGKLYERHVYSRHFPRLEETFVELGIATDGENARLLPDAPALALRQRIMQPPPAAADITCR